MAMARKIQMVRYLSRNLSLGFPGVIRDLLSLRSEAEQEVEPHADDQDPGDLLQDAVGLAQSFRFEERLGRPHRSPGDKDKGRMPQRIDQEQEAPVKNVPL